MDWINPTGAKKVHSLIDKVYQRKNLEMAWEMVKANRGSGGADGQNLEAFAAQLDQQVDRLQSELKEDVYRPQPEKLLTLVSQRIADGRVLRLIEAMLKAGSYGKGGYFQLSAGLRKAVWFHPCSATYF